MGSDLLYRSSSLFARKCLLLFDLWYLLGVVEVMEKERGFPQHQQRRFKRSKKEKQKHTFSSALDHPNVVPEFVFFSYFRLSLGDFISPPIDSAWWCRKFFGRLKQRTFFRPPPDSKCDCAQGTQNASRLQGQEARKSHGRRKKQSRWKRTQLIRLLPTPTFPLSTPWQKISDAMENGDG